MGARWLILAVTVALLPLAARAQSDGGAARVGVGSLCTSDLDCTFNEGICLHGFCTVLCNRGESGDLCRDLAAVPPGPYGDAFRCYAFPAGGGICWPSGSGASCSADGGACPWAGEICDSGRCRYTRDPLCYRDVDCAPREYCVPFLGTETGNDLRFQGLCLERGEGELARAAPSSPCDEDADCGSLVCDLVEPRTCAAMCASDADCEAGRKCIAHGTVILALDEFSTAYLSYCEAFAGSGVPCVRHADCADGETCAPYLSLFGPSAVGVRHACRSRLNPGGGLAGAPCSTGGDCADGDCLVDPRTASGYCRRPCPGGDSECALGTQCRLLPLDLRDPVRSDDDLRAPLCVRVGEGAICAGRRGCRSCSSDEDCLPSQGVTCVRELPADPVGVCQDGVGRCIEPCLRCNLLANDCPQGTRCVRHATSFGYTYCLTADFGCVPADLPPTFTAEDGMCGDPQFLPGSTAALPQHDRCQQVDSAPSDGGVPLFECRLGSAEVDGGVGEADGGPPAGTDGGAVADGGAAAPMNGGSCRQGPVAGAPPGSFLLLAAVLGLAALRRRRRRLPPEAKAPRLPTNDEE